MTNKGLYERLLTLFAYYAEGNVQARRDRRAKSKEPGQAGLQRDLESEWREREGGDKVKEQKGKQELSGEMRPLQGAEAFAVCNAIWERTLYQTWTSRNLINEYREL